MENKYYYEVVLKAIYEAGDKGVTSYRIWKDIEAGSWSSVEKWALMLQTLGYVKMKIERMHKYSTRFRRIYFITEKGKELFDENGEIKEKKKKVLDAIFGAKNVKK